MLLRYISYVLCTNFKNNKYVYIDWQNPKDVMKFLQKIILR